MNITLFLEQKTPLIDVRSPSEFQKGHIPGAISLPLFSDEERSIVGTIYKQQGKDPAIKKGLFFVGPKLLSFVEEAEKITGPSKTLRLYCARGGMRSSSLAWLLQTSGFTCILLDKGYKSFRNWTLTQFTKKYEFLVLGGFTGSGKTDILHELNRNNEQTIDLEGLANHKGSSFGDLEGLKQPSCEQFENLLASTLSKQCQNSPIWIEDESRNIGLCYLPEGIWSQMRLAPLLWIEQPLKNRINHLLSCYGNYSQELLIKSAEKLHKKLGAVKTAEVTEKIQNHDLVGAITDILKYYDKTYIYSSLKNPRNRINVPFTSDLMRELTSIKKLIKIK